MNHTLQDLMRDAARLTQAGRLSEATAAIQRALGGGPRLAMPVATLAAAGEVLEGCVFESAPQRTAGKPAPAKADDGEFRAGSYTHSSLTRQYKLYVPPERAGQALPLVVMLHGCTQNPDDFAAGTDMNNRAREQGFCVLYPAQGQEANPSRCWNWFKHSHQTRERGEAALIAALTRAVMQEQGTDPQRVFIAGLSAGGAMAGLVAAAHPELFAAVGVHSGLAPGAARTLPEAMAAMKGGAAPGHAPVSLSIPLIVFHGDQDSTVHPLNGEQLIAAATVQGGTASRIEPGQSAQGRRHTRTLHMGTDGSVAAEHWLLHGAGHAWAGGQATGSYTDPKGPDATREMLRFFFEHPRQAGH
ncbi:extracellular catalytic domain type 1 short-chain-length polyhydroxyalkanoate depolymerase [Roseateles toxinivorans]|uniref:Poly(Hydroxyalkanoate) depolymerase family esterase n=1 Tax=Roseateles toxinivorans TaxID=270368 RepID=A0A4R6QLK5_9BURK|nr:PHB depolymerase family esterase [Roseateles toxinivorans]TDP64293.1 poly(hydroxyalkanoate) depolymerase family esterase [Roseateles toxinivorans]